jgi:hypothetical protein
VLGNKNSFFIAKPLRRRKRQPRARPPAHGPPPRATPPARAALASATRTATAM